MKPLPCINHNNKEQLAHCKRKKCGPRSYNIMRKCKFYKPEPEKIKK